MMTLLYTKRSPYARKVRVFAIEKGIDLNLIDENLQNKSNRLKEANPLGKIPTLISADGQAIYDSHVICVYLDAIKPLPRLIPMELKARMDVLKWEAFANDLMTIAINVYLERLRHPNDANTDFINSQEKTIRSAYSYIEEKLDQLKDFNLASITVACAIGYVYFRIPHLKTQGQLTKWCDAINQRPSMAQTMPVA